MTFLRQRFVSLITLLSILGSTSLVTAQDPGLPDLLQKGRFGAGTHVFRRCLHEMKFKPLKGFDELDPHESVLIILGDPRPLGKLKPGLREFLRQGGAVFLATDWVVDEKNARELIDLANIRITGEAIVNPNKDVCYDGHEYQPTLVAPNPVDPSDTFLLRTTDPASGVVTALRVATDLPARIVVNGALPPELTKLAYLPRGCRLESGNPLRDPPEKIAPLFAVGGEIDGGKLLVMADHSVFINAVMSPSDTQNVEFTYNALTWLRERGDEHRSSALVITDGEVESVFEVPLKPRKLTPRQMRALAAAYIDEMLHHLETKGDIGFFNEKLNAYFTRFWPFLIAILSSMLCFYLFYRFLFAASFKREPSLALLSRFVALHRPEGPVIGERHEAQLREDNLLEEARGLAREFFAKGLDRESCPKKKPKFVFASWWQKTWLTSRLERIWKLARGKKPPPVTKKLWKATLRDLEVLREARADNLLTLLPAKQEPS